MCNFMRACVRATACVSVRAGATVTAIPRTTSRLSRATSSPRGFVSKQTGSMLAGQRARGAEILARSRVTPKDRTSHTEKTGRGPPVCAEGGGGSGMRHRTMTGGKAAAGMAISGAPPSHTCCRLPTVNYPLSTTPVDYPCQLPLPTADGGSHASG